MNDKRPYWDCWQVVQELQALEQAITGLPQAASLIGSAANTAVADAQNALSDTGRAIAQGNFTEALNITVTAAENLQKVFNETATQVLSPSRACSVYDSDSGSCCYFLEMQVPSLGCGWPSCGAGFGIL